MSLNILVPTLYKQLFRASRSKYSLRTMSSEEPDVIFESIKDKGVITLNRPKALNALNLSMIDKLLPMLKQWEKEKALVIVKGAGEKAFCAGGDIRAVRESGLRGDRDGQDFFRREYILNGMIGTFGIPYIALIDGIVMGGGVGLSVHGHYRVATERSLFAMPETAIGLFPDVGGSYFLSRLGGKLGLYLALTGFRLKGSDVFKAGIATHFVESKSLPDLEKELIECANEQDINKTLKKYAFNESKEFSLQQNLQKINTCFSAKTIEEIISNLENDGTEWAQDTIKTLNKMSPTSLKISIKELEHGAKMTLQECLQMEYRLACNCLVNKDFFEGVRALLVDKDQNPKWQPATLGEVTDKYIETYFAKLPENEELKHKL